MVEGMKAHEGVRETPAGAGAPAALALRDLCGRLGSLSVDHREGVWDGGSISGERDGRSVDRSRMNGVRWEGTRRYSRVSQGLETQAKVVGPFQFKSPRRGLLRRVDRGIRLLG